MDFIDEIKLFSKKVEKLKSQIQTEAATKTSLVLPFFQLLGYDIFNPQEFIPEFTADVGIKKGEKVDYAIIRDNKPIILIEVKWCNEDLQKHDSQLFRYFGTTTSKFAILTNGIIYKFYTDLEQSNKMDETPFLEINVSDIKENLIPELKKFHKSNFDIDSIFNSASELKYSNKVKLLMAGQINNPSDSFVKYVLNEIYDGLKTQPVIAKFKALIKNSFNQFVNELINERIKSAIEKVPEEKPKEETQRKEDVKEQEKIITTITELEGFFIIKGILRDLITPNRINYRDTESYLSMLIDNNKHKWICRLYLGKEQTYLGIPDENKKESKYKFENLDEIYNYRKQLEEVVKRYI